MSIGKLFNLPFYIRLAIVLVIIIALWVIAAIGKPVFSPLMVALLFAVLLLPLANWMENRLHFSRASAAIVSVLALLVVISSVTYLLGSQLASLSTEWPQLKTQLSSALGSLEVWIGNTFHVQHQKQLTYIHDATDSLLNSSTTILSTAVVSVSSIILFWVFILLYTFFILFYRRLLVRFITVAFTEKYMDVIAEIIREVRNVIRGYIVGLSLEMAIVAALAMIIFLLIGIKYVIFLALIVGIFNLIPYVGIFTALLISMIVTFSTSDLRHTLLVGGGIVLIHLFDSNILMPRIVGSHVRINPLFVVLGVVSGELLWGVTGMFLAIPYLAIAKVIFDRVEGLQPWGILLGEEEATPRKIKRLQRWMKKKGKTEVRSPKTEERSS